MTNRRPYEWEANAKRRYENLAARADFQESVKEVQSRVANEHPEGALLFVGDFMANWGLPGAAFDVYFHYFQTGEWDWTKVVPPVTVYSSVDNKAFPADFNSLDTQNFDHATNYHQLSNHSDTLHKDRVALYLSPDATVTAITDFLEAHFNDVIEPKLKAMRTNPTTSPRRRRMRERDAEIYNLWLKHRDAKKVVSLLDDVEGFEDEVITPKDVSQIVSRQQKQGKLRTEFLGLARETPPQ